MSKIQRFKNAKDKRDSGGFYAIPRTVLNGTAYLSLSAHGRMLLLDLFAQFNGSNNGDLCAAFSVMQKRGWRSTHTLQNAKKELLASELIFETRKGARPNKASLYAVTWQALDDCGGKLDIKPSAFPRGAYRMRDPLPFIPKIAALNAPATSAVSKLMH